MPAFEQRSNDPGSLWNMDPITPTDEDLGLGDSDFETVTDQYNKLIRPASSISDDESYYSNDELLMRPRTPNQRTRKIHPPTTRGKTGQAGPKTKQVKIPTRHHMQELIMDVEDALVRRGGDVKDLKNKLNELLRKENRINNPIKENALTVQYYKDVKKMMQNPDYEQEVRDRIESDEKQKRIDYIKSKIPNHWFERYNELKYNPEFVIHGVADGLKKHRKSKKPRKFKKRKTKKRKTKKRKTKKRKTKKRKTNKRKTKKT